MLLLYLITAETPVLDMANLGNGKNTLSIAIRLGS